MKKILVVDDDHDITEIVKYILTLNGFDVRTHDTGLGVPDIVLHYKPNLILLDILLPGKLGTDICKDLKKIHSHIPIILFSAHADQGKAYQVCNAESFIHKPFDIKDLVNTIKLHLN